MTEPVSRRSRVAARLRAQRWWSRPAGPPVDDEFPPLPPDAPDAPASEAAVGTGWPGALPPWFRRGVFLVLSAIALFQVLEWAFANLRGFLGLVFLSWLFAISVEPLVGALARRGMRRGAATGLVLLGLVALVVAFGVLFGALLVDQLGELISALPDAVRNGVDWVNVTFDTDFRPADIVASLQLTPGRVQSILQQLTPGVVGIVTALIGLLFQGFTFLLFAYYMSAEGPALRRSVSRRFPPRHQLVIATVWEIAVRKTGGYVVSRLLLALISGVITGVVLVLLDVPYWLPLAIWTGAVSQFIPTIGTYLAIAVPALISLSGDPSDALWVVVFGIVYQQVENYLIGPRITARTVDVHPAVALGAVIAGAALFGAMGALVSIPVVAAVQAVLETYVHRYELVAPDHPVVPVVPAANGPAPGEAAARPETPEPTVDGQPDVLRPAPVADAEDLPGRDARGTG
ncbi:AI-2E family transporter [Modestobacter marinus]|uniref:AI-2E family transporter n=1 Tax=Modestobacter marinus TaxID=477641 RepID=UPI001C985A85|nr:AI-2E family transporter [Modestobacter marinus]